MPAVLGDVHKTAEGQLLDVVQAMDSLRLQFHAAHGGQEQGRENADDGYRHQQFDQRESAPFLCHLHNMRPRRAKNAPVLPAIYHGTIYWFKSPSMSRYD